MQRNFTGISHELKQVLTVVLDAKTPEQTQFALSAYLQFIREKSLTPESLIRSLFCQNQGLSLLDLAVHSATLSQSSKTMKEKKLRRNYLVNTCSLSLCWSALDTIS